MQSKQDTSYTLKETITTPGAIVRVFTPEITAEERARRMKAIHKAAASLLRAATK